MSERLIRLFATLAERYPEADDTENAKAVGLAALTAVFPLLQPLIEGVITPSLAKRRVEWLKELAEMLERLERRVEGLSFEKLRDNEQFVSAVVQANRIAQATAAKEKRAYLRNALLNIAMAPPVENDKCQVFLDALEQLTVSHVKILSFFHDGTQRMNRAGKWSPQDSHQINNFTAAILALHPEFKAMQDLIPQLTTDLYNRGFSQVRTSDQSFPQNPAITNLGIEFLNFIKEPPE